MPQRDNSGRKKDSIWLEFDLRENRAFCKSCAYDCVPLVARLKKHFGEKHGFRSSYDGTDESGTEDTKATPPKQPKISNFVVSTTSLQKHHFDLAVGRFFYACNIPFNCVENPHFRDLIRQLHPGYAPPNRKSLSDAILDEVHGSLVESAKTVLDGKDVTMCIDGWSNVANVPIIAATVQSDDKVYIVDSIDTSGERHTSEYLADIAEKQINVAREKFGVNVIGLVTDNAENMAKMRRIVSASTEVIQYGCSAHQLNLLAKEVAPINVINRVVEVAKFFRNTHLPKAWLDTEGAKHPPLPSAVRWNSSLHLLLWYQESWQKIRAVIDDNSEYFGASSCKNVAKIVKDMALYQNVDDSIKALKPICVALQLVQENKINVAEALEVWKNLLDEYRQMGDAREWLSKVEARYDKSVPPVWFVANALHPKFIGSRLTQKEWKDAVNWVQNEAPDVLTSFIDFMGGEKEEIHEAFVKSPGAKMNNFLKAQCTLGSMKQDLFKLASKLLKLAPSSAGLERVFSSMGFVHSEVRNRLEPEKVTKLAFCLRVLNDKV